MLARGLAAALAAVMLLGVALPSATSASDDRIVLAQAEGTRDGELEPKYRPREPEPEPAYQTSLIFAMTRGVADAPIAPAGKLPLYLFTIPLDLVLLPFALIGGFF